LVLVTPTSLGGSQIDEVTHTVRLDRRSVFSLVTCKERGAAALVCAEARSSR
jgi:hypothetical protein